MSSFLLFQTYNFYIYSYAYLLECVYKLQLVIGLVLTLLYQGTFDGLAVYRRNVEDCKGGKRKIAVERNVQYNGFFAIGAGAQLKFYDCTDTQKDDILNFYIFLSFQILACMLAILLTAIFMVWLDLPRLRNRPYTLFVYFFYLGIFLFVVVGGGLLFCYLTVYCMDMSLYFYFIAVYLVLVNATYEDWNKVRKENNFLTGTVGDFLKGEEKGEEKGKEKGEEKGKKGNSKVRKGRKGRKGGGKKKWTHT